MSRHDGEIRNVHDSTAAPTCSYCGWLGWTVEKYGRVTHKQACPHRTDPWHQGDQTAAHTPPRRRLLVMATVEIPTDRDWTTDRMQRDVEGALTDYGYFVVRAAVEPIKENV